MRKVKYTIEEWRIKYTSLENRGPKIVEKIVEKVVEVPIEKIVEKIVEVQVPMIDSELS